jgi:nucleotide-binding universal stress UspA family protein
MKRILVPVDFTDNSNNALSYAQILFGDIPCSFYLMNVYVSYRTDLMSEEFDDDWLSNQSEESINEIELLVDRLKKTSTNEGHRFEGISIANTLAEAIKEFSKDTQLDYIVMENRSKGNIGKVFLGSKTGRVINGIHNCPIFVVPQDYKIKKPKKIAFSTNFKHAFNEWELQPLLKLVKLWDSSLKIVHHVEEGQLNDSERRHRNALLQLLNGVSYTFNLIQVHTTEVDNLGDFVQNSQCDLLSLINHKYSFLYKLVQKDVVKHLVFNSPTPILILPEKVD